MALFSKRQFTKRIASKNKRALKKVTEAMVNNYIKLVPTNDMIGVEIGGSFKNAYTIAVGMCDGLGYGLNTKAAILTYALQLLNSHSIHKVLYRLLL